MSATIHIERMMHRNSVAVQGDTVASYALIKLIPTAGAVKPLNLNLALVLDVSGSMYEQDGTGITRLKRIQEAAISAIGQLKPHDTLAVVAFGSNAALAMASSPIGDKSRVKDVIQRIDMYHADPGGTTMEEGMSMGLEEVEKNIGEERLSQVVILTDGETSGEPTCRRLAQQAAHKNIPLTLMGVGTEWNSSLIKELARLSDGNWYYIDVNEAQEAQRVFLQEFRHLAATAFTRVEMHLRPVKDVRIKRVRQVVPEIKDLKLAQLEERHFMASLGTLEVNQATRYVVDLSLPRRPDGKYVVAQLEVTYKPGVGQRESTGKVPLEMTYTSAGQGYINAEVARHIDEVQIFELNNNLQQAIATSNQAEVQRLAENIAKKGDLMGPRAAKKTMLARQVLHELNHGGRVSRKTQLAVDDAARLAEQMPTG
jgi:Ca-activated chloride channel family protein